MARGASGITPTGGAFDADWLGPLLLLSGTWRGSIAFYLATVYRGKRGKGGKVLSNSNTVH